MADTADIGDDDLFEEKHGEDRSPLAFVVYLLFRAATGAFVRMPWSWNVAIIGGVSRLARRFDRRHSDAARRFLETAHPGIDEQERERRVLVAYRHFFTVVLETQRMLRLTPEDLRARFDFVLDETAQALFDSDQGFVIASAHEGNWESGSLGLQLLGERQFYGVAKPAKNNFLSRYVYRMREARGVKILPRRGAMGAAPKIVNSGQMIALLLDQRARTKPVMAPFFGRPARCDRSLGVLLRRLKAPVLLCCCYRTERPGYFRFEIGPVLPAEELGGMDPLAVSTRINVELERIIRVAPEQYFWLHDRFRDAPAPAETPDATPVHAPDA